MKYTGWLLALLVILTATAYSQSDIGGFFEQLREEALEFNATVTDQEIVEYLEFQYEIDPPMLDEFREAMRTPENRKTFFKNYRGSHNEGSIKIPTLRGMSEKEMAQLRELFKYKKKEYYDALDAERRLEGLSKAQLGEILREGAKFIERYESLRQGNPERTVRISENFPPSLNYLKLRFIDVSERHCSLYLQKGIGKGIGLTVSRENGELVLSSFNHYKSWDRHKVAWE